MHEMLKMLVSKLKSLTEIVKGLLKLHKANIMCINNIPKVHLTNQENSAII